MASRVGASSFICSSPSRGATARWAGEPLVLIHGGWGGARLHWGAIWERLASSYRVIAPDLPGIGRTDQSSLGSIGAYARWLDALLSVLDVESAWCVGNSLGAAVACRFASDYGARCRGLILVNGFPLPSSPRILQWLGERPRMRNIVRTVERWVAYRPSALKRGFVRADNVPEELYSLVRSKSPPQLDALADILVHGGSPAPLHFRPLLLWGENDRLPGTTARSARRLQASWPGATLAFVGGAGHLPQVENPEAFLAALGSFVSLGSRAPRVARPSA